MTDPRQSAWPGSQSSQHTGINPFSQPPSTINPYGHYEVQTSFVPHVEGTVPSVNPPGPGMAFPGTITPAAPVASGVGSVSGPTSSKPSYFKLPFTNSTAVPAVQGNIGGPQRGPDQLAPGASRINDDGQFGATQQGQSQPSQSDSRPLLGGDAPKEDPSKYPFYNVRRYRPYFDVDTKEVLWRVGNSFIGAVRPNFMQVTQERPDFYGPFWVCTTLVFVTAVAGNYAHFLEWRKQNNTSGSTNGTALSPPPSSSSSSNFEDNQWFTDYTKLSISAGVYYGYVFVISLVLFFIMKYLRGDMRLPHMYCAYGYAMTIYIPVAILCVIPVEGLRWGLVGGATLTSGAFLLMNMRERIMAIGMGKSIPLLLVIFGLHCALGLVLMLVFFKY